MNPKPDPAKDQDTVDARTKAGQAAMDAAIGEATGEPAAKEAAKAEPDDARKPAETKAATGTRAKSGK